MSRPKFLITEKEASQAIVEREAIKDWALVERLSAVIAYASHSAREVAQIFGVTAVSVIYWAHAFRKHGVDGLRDGAKGHRKRKLTGANAETVRQWILSSKDIKGKRVHWTLKRLCLEIKEHLGLELACSTLSDTLGEMNLVIKRPRPMHYHYDQKKAEEFKKKLRK
jgi:transposase